MRKISPLLIAAVFCPSLVSFADTVATCSGDSAGRSYYMYGGIIPEGESGFGEDSTPSMKVSLTLSDEGNWDILWVDARNEIYSARDSGGNVSFIGIGATGFSIGVVYNTDVGLVTGIYALSLRPDNKWELSISQQKQLNSFTNTGFEVVACQYVDLDNIIEKIR